MTVCPFALDDSKPGRIMQTANVGGAFMSHLMIQPGVVTGGYYHKKTDVVMYAAYGQLQATFEQVITGESKTFILQPDRHVIHVPPYHKITTKNIGEAAALLVAFSNKPLRDRDDSYVEIPKRKHPTDGIDIFSFDAFTEAPGAKVRSVKVGPIYMNKVMIEPKTTIGPRYHTHTDTMFYLAAGHVHVMVEDVVSKTREEVTLKTASDALQMRRKHAIQLTNLEDKQAEMIVFSNRRLNGGDAVPYSFEKR